MVVAPLRLSLLTYFMEIFLIMLVNKNLFYKIIFTRLRAHSSYSIINDLKNNKYK